MTNTVSDPTAATSVELDAATQRQLGVDLYNSTWTLLEKPDRSPAESDENRTTSWFPIMRAMTAPEQPFPGVDFSQKHLPYGAAAPDERSKHKAELVVHKRLRPVARGMGLRPVPEGLQSHLHAGPGGNLPDPRPVLDGSESHPTERK